MKKTDLPVTLPKHLTPYDLLERLFGEDLGERFSGPTRRPFEVDLALVPDRVYDNQGQPIPYTQRGWEGLLIAASVLGKRGGLVYLNEVEVIPYTKTKQEKLEEVWNLMVELDICKDEMLEYLKD